MIGGVQRIIVGSRYGVIKALREFGNFYGLHSKTDYLPMLRGVVDIFLMRQVVLFVGEHKNPLITS